MYNEKGGLNYRLKFTLITASTVNSDYRYFYYTPLTVDITRRL